VQMIRAGWAGGTVEGANGVPHYYTKETVAQIAQKANGAKFGRTHPDDAGGREDPDRIAGWFEGGKLVGRSAVSTLSLLKSETEMQQTFRLHARLGSLDLFGLSILRRIAGSSQRVMRRKANALSLRRS
jgi:hypothetical protein